jgi:probable addiction module antidote protein
MTRRAQVARASRTARKKSKTYRYDSADYLDSSEAITAYMEEALETDDPAFIAKALGTIARARGMSQVAKKAGLSRESLYKALGSEGNPEFGTVIRVMQALGLKLSIRGARGR